MKISNNTEIIFKKNGAIQITEKFSSLNINTKILLDVNNIFVRNESVFEKTKLYDDKVLFDFSLFSEDRLKKAHFALETHPSIGNLSNLSDVKKFTMKITIHRFESGSDNYQDRIVFTFTEKNSNLFDIINVLKHLSLYLKKYGKVVRVI